MPPFDRVQATLTIPISGPVTMLTPNNPAYDAGTDSSSIARASLSAMDPCLLAIFLLRCPRHLVSRRGTRTTVRAHGFDITRKDRTMSRRRRASPKSAAPAWP